MGNYNQIRQDMENCILCGACYDVCPMDCFSEDGIMERPDDCGSCGQCIDECPEGALGVSDV